MFNSLFKKKNFKINNAIFISKDHEKNGGFIFSYELNKYILSDFKKKEFKISPKYCILCGLDHGKLYSKSNVFNCDFYFNYLNGNFSFHI